MFSLQFVSLSLSLCVCVCVCVCVRVGHNSKAVDGFGPNFLVRLIFGQFERPTRLGTPHPWEGTLGVHCLTFSDCRAEMSNFV